MTTLRWGILSTANIATEKVIPGIRRAARDEIVAIASRDGETARRGRATALSIPRAHGSYEALLADPDVDAVYIPLPNHLHAEWTIAAARAGKHVLCEKPLALTAADAERMIEAAEAAGVHLMEAFMYRHHPSWVAVRELVASGRIGTLTAVQSWFAFYNDDPRTSATSGTSAVARSTTSAATASTCRGCCSAASRSGSRARSSGTARPATASTSSRAGLLEFEDGLAAFGCSIRTEPDQRVDIYGSDGRISIGIPFNIPPDRPTQVFVTTGGDPPVAPATETLTFETKDPYAARPSASRRPSSTACRRRFPPSDAVANLRVIERLFAAADDARGARA